MIKAIIVDDEPKAVEVLSNKLTELFPDIEIAGKFTNPSDAINFINHNELDLSFLDIEMPIKSGFDVIKEVQNLDFEIIFVTGYQEYAIHAIQFSAIGYILKPVDDEDLELAVKNAKSKIKLKRSSERNHNLLQNLISANTDKKVGIPTMYGLEFVKLGNIIRCEGLQKCTKVIVENGENIISSYSIGEFLKLLDPYEFFSVHKSHLINLHRIKKYFKEGTILMDDDSTVPLARRRKQMFLDRLQKI